MKTALICNPQDHFPAVHKLRGHDSTLLLPALPSFPRKRNPRRGGVPRLQEQSTVLRTTGLASRQDILDVMRTFSLLFAFIALVMLAMFLIYVIRGPVDPLIAAGIFVSFVVCLVPALLLLRPFEPPEELRRRREEARREREERRRSTDEPHRGSES